MGLVGTVRRLGTEAGVAQKMRSQAPPLAGTAALSLGPTL